jgi:hypothetical protein
VYITVQKEIRGNKPSNPIILACDIGEKVMLTSVMLDNGFVGSHRFYMVERLEELGDIILGLERGLEIGSSLE